MEIYKNLDINDLDGELWKQIENFPDYDVSNLGRIKSFKQNKICGKILKQKKDKDGYLEICLCQNNKKYYFRVHRLVYESFKEKPKRQVNHIDGNKENNYIGNLEDLSCSENHKHAFKIGLKDHKCENHNLAKLNNKQVQLIKMIFETYEFKSKKITIRFIAEKFQVNSATISSIKSGKNWNDIKIRKDIDLINKLNKFLSDLNGSAQNQEGENNPNNKLEKWKVKSIYQISNSPIIKQLKITQKEIGEIFEISQTLVSEIKLEKIWSHIKVN